MVASLNLISSFTGTIMVCREKISKIVEKVRLKLSKNTITTDMYEKIIKKNIPEADFFPPIQNFTCEFEVTKKALNGSGYIIEDIEEYLVYNKNDLKKAHAMLKNIQNNFKDFNVRHTSSLGVNDAYKNNRNLQGVVYNYCGIENLSSGVYIGDGDSDIVVNKDGKIPEKSIDATFYFFIELDSNMQEKDVKTVCEIIKGYLEKV